MSTSVHLDANTQRALERLAKNRSRTRSEIVRQAIEMLVAREQQRPFEMVSDLIGCVQGGPSDLSENTGRKFRELLAQKKA